jgi:hypothetical protein
VRDDVALVPEIGVVRQGAAVVARRHRGARADHRKWLRSGVHRSPDGQREDEWPEIFKDAEKIAKKGFWLYDRAQPRFQRVPWGSIGTEDDKAAYKKCVIELAGQIGSRLEEIHAPRSRP